MKTTVTAAALGALVVVNGCLFAAVEHRQGGTVQRTATARQTASSPASSTAARPSVSATPASAQTSSATQSSSASEGRHEPRVYVAALGHDKAWRVTGAADCGGEAVTVQTTTNAGQSWRTMSAPPAAAVTGVTTDGSGHLVITGRAKGGCGPARSWTFSGSWGKTTDATWTTVGDGSRNVLRDGKSVAACSKGSVLDTASTSAGLEVLCTGGVVREVPASGDASPKTVYDSSGTVSIATAADGTLVVAKSSSTCDGVEIASVTDKSAHRITCVQGAAEPVDLTFAGDDGWLVVKHNTWKGGLTGDWSKS